MGIPIAAARRILLLMDALYLAIETSGPDPIKDQIAQLSARFRRDDLTYVDLNQRVGEENISAVLLQFSKLRQDCDVLVGHNLQHQLDFILAACVRTGDTSLFIHLRRCKILCTKALATHCHESEGKIGSTVLADLLDEFTGAALTADSNAEARVVATEIIHQAIFGRLQELPNFARVGRDLVQLNVN
jgi:DNA polymerase III epsilon subunit-like protein